MSVLLDYLKVRKKPNKYGILEIKYQKKAGNAYDFGHLYRYEYYLSWANYFKEKHQKYIDSIKKK